MRSLVILLSKLQGNNWPAESAMSGFQLKSRQLIFRHPPSDKEVRIWSHYQDSRPLSHHKFQKIEIWKYLRAPFLDPPITLGRYLLRGLRRVSRMAPWRGHYLRRGWFCAFRSGGGAAGAPGDRPVAGGTPSITARQPTPGHARAQRSGQAARRPGHSAGAPGMAR